MNLKAFFYVLRHLNAKTLYFNFKYLNFRSAIKFPFFISRHVYFKNLSGSIEIINKVPTGGIKIGLGDVGVFDKKRSRTVLELKGKIIFEGSANIGHGAKLSVGEKGELVFGKDFNLTAESKIICCEKVSFGAGCLISWDVLIIDTDFHQILKDQQQINKNMPIILADNIWVGAGSIILKGVNIASNTVVAAGSVVSKTSELSNCIIAGNPATVVKENIEWKI